MDPVMSSPVRDVFSTLLHDVVLWAMVVTSYNYSASVPSCLRCICCLRCIWSGGQGAATLGCVGQLLFQCCVISASGCVSIK